jgi:hypothetical protein
MVELVLTSVSLMGWQEFSDTCAGRMDEPAWLVAHPDDEARGKRLDRGEDFEIRVNFLSVNGERLLCRTGGFRQLSEIYARAVTGATP